jgi:microcystin degradation protein MlrC
VSLRVAIGGVFHETNTYGVPTTLSQFLVLRDDAILAFCEGSDTYLGGMCAAVRDRGAQLLPVLYAEATPSGIIAGTAFRALCDELVSGIVREQPDAVVLALHGAGAAENADSIEETMCARLRQELGDAVPLVATLDLHGNLRPALAESCDALFPVRRNPHTDQIERGREAAICALDLAAGKPKLCSVIEPIPLLMPLLPTSHPALAAATALCQELEHEMRLTAVRLMHGFPYADLPHLGMSVVAVGSSHDDARAAARRVARYIWSRRTELVLEQLSASDAVAHAAAVEGPVLINEFSDNTGAGAPGDGTQLLSALLEARMRACFSHIFDPETVLHAHRAGVRARIPVKLGGKTDRRHGPTLHVTAEVLSLGTGGYRVKSDMGRGEPIDLGLLCALRIETVDVIVTSGRRQTLDDGPFIKAGIDIADHRVVALKSSQHFRAFFERSYTVVTANPPGISTADVTAFERKRASSDLWPLNRAATYPSTHDPEPAVARGETR